jgi:AraC family transcriptional regulator
MPYITQIADAIAFVEDNLREPIAVGDMADAISYSLYYFCRTFNEATHHTPYNYMMRRRLSEAARELLATDRRIIDIALEYQFNNPETFSRAFRRMFGVLPSELRKKGHIDSRRLMPRLGLAHLQWIATEGGRRPSLQERGDLNLAGVMSLVQDDPSVVPVLWRYLWEELVRIPSSSGPADHFGVAWYPPGWENRGYFYMAAIATEPMDPPRTGLVSKTLPAASYVCFFTGAPVEDLVLTLDYAYHTWLPKSGVIIDYALVLEHYGADIRGHDQDPEVGMYFPIAAEPGG